MLKAGDRVRLSDVVIDLRGEPGYLHDPPTCAGTVTEMVNAGITRLGAPLLVARIAWDDGGYAGKTWRLGDLVPA